MTKEHLAKSIKDFNHNKLVKRKTKKIFWLSFLQFQRFRYCIYPLYHLSEKL